MEQRFSPTNNAIFFKELRKRVNAHFKEQNRSRHSDNSMIFKSFAVFSTYFLPYSLVLFGAVTTPWLVILCGVMMGFGMAGIGLNIMHDANHQAYSSNRSINRFLGYSMNLIGANCEIWKLQHNQLHHTYTNIEAMDDDINTPNFLRFSPHRKLRAVHRYQYIYVWFFYCLSTLSWVLSKEFIQLKRYNELGLIGSKKRYNQILTQLIGWKLFYYLYVLVLPMIFAPISPWLILAAFFALHFSAGLITSSIFQTAHIMPNCDYPLSKQDEEMENSWVVHEMLTTSNYSPKSKLFSWLIGGLNYQIEHHLFPSICHVHYHQISKIVAITAEEFGIPYNVEKTFFSALVNHTKMLRNLGQEKLVIIAAD